MGFMGNGKKILLVGWLVHRKDRGSHADIRFENETGGRDAGGI
ncbi:hypothetical protein IB211_02142c [Intestinimonas butyriciproducens]|uniref:Uncharacterized protein n=1 Tax=Intestinimonas butyriciproducens TaxID=1297617 RepID=A0A0S2W5A4_9FIRM|nr:hypothetical protein IB211_02142c [Intestinimonas butyriciproducens]